MLNKKEKQVLNSIKIKFAHYMFNKHHIVVCFVSQL
jgi:hypothetical protein